MKEAIHRATAYEKAGADAIIIHSKEKTPDEIFDFTDNWTGTIPIVVIPTTYDSVKISDLVSHNIKMVIFANQTLRASHASMLKLLNQMSSAEKISDVTEDMSKMEEIFGLQQMYEHKSQEGKIKEELKKMGYISWKN